ncbi:triose-phosphate isomerase [Thermostichus vulcanus]|uniref:Triosephosphate isomerase n=1 Tax=Thermostichus vulcanus str. 'Rupite' TaxID=2813851 RepID=A0ABT0CDZ3_THEVL|nr:triose-phosphate isomerase [Thermostichus vulcanus]MCJ2543988.1 triose-phosphate isomerase [Thermostichus vulcanus str. 'Rupite']
MRPILIAGNWKMHKTQAQAREFLREFGTALQSSSQDSVPLTRTVSERQVILCVPYTDLAVVVEQTQGSGIAVGAQNLHWEDQGAFTGEISGPMLVELGVRYVIVGHSERRQYFGESDETVNQRLAAAQRHGLIPILCVGESKHQRDQGLTESWILEQLDRGLAGIDLEHLVIAYEPIWAIGTGETCAAQEANRVIGLIRQHVGQAHLSILYGGSVKASNIDEIMAQPQIDGVLVGGASLEPKEFARIANYQALATA